MDMVVKSIVNKSTNKVYIIQNIDRKLDLEDIAKAKGMNMDDLLSEIPVDWKKTKGSSLLYVQKRLEKAGYKVSFNLYNSTLFFF